MTVPVTTYDLSTVTTVATIPYSCYTYLEPTPVSSGGKFPLYKYCFPSLISISQYYFNQELTKSSQPTVALLTPQHAPSRSRCASSCRPSQSHAMTLAVRPLQRLRRKEHVPVAGLVVRRQPFSWRLLIALHSWLISGGFCMSFGAGS